MSAATQSTSRPLEKWRNKESVDALVQGDITRAGEAAAGVHQLYKPMLKTEDGAEAAEGIKGATQRTGAHLLAAKKTTVRTGRI